MSDYPYLGQGRIKAFEVGRTYQCRSIGDYGCVWYFRVVKRTAKTITLEGDTDTPEPIVRRIYEYEGVEHLRPFGTYSMCPILGADAQAEDTALD